MKANTGKQRITLLNKNKNGDIYTVFNHPFYGGAILKNNEKIYEVKNEDIISKGYTVNEMLKLMLGRLCIDNNLMDNYSNIL